MKIKFKQGINHNQEFLFPRKLSEFLPEDHLAKTIREIVDQLNLSRIEEKYSEIGQHAYDPKIMVSLLFYGYCKLLWAKAHSSLHQRLPDAFCNTIPEPLNTTLLI